MKDKILLVGLGLIGKSAYLARAIAHRAPVALISLADIPKEPEPPILLVPPIEYALRDLDSGCASTGNFTIPPRTKGSAGKYQHGWLSDA